jgi:hypothetical protein
LFSKTFDIAAILLPTSHWLRNITEAGFFWKFLCQTGIKRPKTTLDSLSPHFRDQSSTTSYTVMRWPFEPHNCSHPALFPEPEPSGVHLL